MRQMCAAAFALALWFPLSKAQVQVNSELKPAGRQLLEYMNR